MGESADITARDALKAVELQPDIGAEKMGAIYAKALIGAAREPAQVVTVLDELAAVILEVLEPFPRLDAVLSSPVIAHAEKSALLDRLCAGKVSPLLIHFLKVVSRRGRLDCLREIHRQARRIYEESLGRKHVRLSTAEPLDKALLDEITQSLRVALGSELILESTVDPELIGGAVLRIEDTVYDGSVANQLESIRQQMIDRSVHEIQSRRDRFRNSAGS